MGRRKLVANIDEKIMNEVMKMTMKVGTGLVSTKEIAKKLQISEPVIFTHFKTKANLMNATFVKACAFTAEDQIARVCLEKGAQATFADYKPAILWTLTFKKEIVYIHHYLASSYYDNEVVFQCLKPFFDTLKTAMKKLGASPEITPEEYDFLTYAYFHSRIDILNSFVEGRFPVDDVHLAAMDRYLVGAMLLGLKIAK
jgi:AcrR family transcriptional regulator